MKSKILIVVSLLIIVPVTTLWAQAPRFSRLELIRNCDCEQRNELDEARQADFAVRMAPAFYFVDSLTIVSPPRERSIGKALLLSAVIPGAGEFYNKSFLKGLAFLGIEAGAWAVYAVYTQRGNDREDAFEAYARTHWSEDKYWASLARLSGCDVNNRPCLRDYESTTFSHFLPDERNQTYYENIGKYDQFNAGWDDSISGEAKERDSANRALYTRMRKKANDQFKIATYGTSIVLINHVISALHAAYTTYKFNREIKASMGMEMQRYDQELVPALAMKMSW
ncbi:hypothetical protein L0337_18345 [candidate division KSB1 bacterium]|nr:hypothetical protein [candidate division KSB1 bacterium]